MPESAKMIIVLTLISGIASLGLAAFNDTTKPAIAENERQFTVGSINRVIPDTDKPNPCAKSKPKFDNSPDQDAVCMDKMLVYRGRKGDEVVGIAVVAVGDEAYSGTITTLVGLDLNGTVTGIEVLKHAETPGLGALIEDCGWRSQLVGQGPETINWKVAKDGGDIDSISGATISSRSMINAIEKAQKLLKDKKDAIVSGKAMAEGEVCDAS